MSLSSVIQPFVFAAFGFCVVSLQVEAGFPPFYRWFSLQPPKDTFIPQIFADSYHVLFAMGISMGLFVATEFQIFYVAFGLAGLWGGWLSRQRVKREIGAPLTWMVHPLTVRWPMLPFDLWTVGVSFLVFMFMVAG